MMPGAMLKAMRKQVLIYALVASAAASLPTLASASFISIGWQQDGIGGITTVGGSGVADNFSASFLTPNFNVTAVNGLTVPTLPIPGLLFSQSNVVGGAGNHFLDLYVTASGLTSP